MSYTFNKIPYSAAKSIYLEINNHPKIVEKYITLGLTKNEAEDLASKISQQIVEYEEALVTFSRDFWGGVVLTILGIIFFIFNAQLSESGNSRLKALKWTLIAGLGMLWSAYNKKKIIKEYEKPDWNKWY